MPLENGAALASRRLLILIACFTLLATASVGFAQQAPPAEPVQPPTATPPAPPLDATRPIPPSPPVPLPTRPSGEAPPTVVVPPPTVPTGQRPDIFLPSVTAAIPGATFQPHFGATLAEEFTDNFFLTPDKRRSNFRTILSPSVGLDINGAFTKGTLGYTLSASHDTVNDSGTNEVELFHSFLGRVIWQATPLLTLTLGDVLTRSDEPAQADRLSLRRERQTFLTNTLDASATYQLGRVATGLSYNFTTFSGSSEADTTSHQIGATASTPIYETNTASFTYTYLLSNTTGEQGSSSDERITGHTFTGTFSRQLTTLLAAGITGSYSMRRTDASRDSASNVGSGLVNSNDYDLWSVALFNSYSSGRLSMSGSIGYSQILPLHGGSSHGTVTTMSSISYQFAKAVATLSADSGFGETFANGQNFGVVETRGITASLFYPITPFITTTLSGFYRTNTIEHHDDQQTWGAIATGAIRLTNWLNLLLEYSYTNVSGGTVNSVSGGTNSGDYYENRARIALSAQF